VGENLQDVDGAHAQPAIASRPGAASLVRTFGRHDLRQTEAGIDDVHRGGLLAPRHHFGRATTGSFIFGHIRIPIRQAPTSALLYRSTISLGANFRLSSTK